MKVLVNFERNEKRERKHVQTHLGRRTKALANNQIYKTKFQRKKPSLRHKIQIGQAQYGLINYKVNPNLAKVTKTSIHI